MSEVTSGPGPMVLLVEKELDPCWATFTRTRPLASLRWGDSTLGERIVRAAGGTPAGVIAEAHLDGFDEEGSLHTVPRPAVAGAPGVLLWATRAAPTGAVRISEATVPITWLIDGRVAGRYVPEGERLEGGPRLGGDTSSGNGRAGSANDASSGDGRAGSASDGSSGDGRAGSASGAIVALDGCWLDSPWQLVATSSDQLGRDLENLSDHGAAPIGHSPLTALPGVHTRGAHPVWVGPDVQVGPGVVFDTRQGPVLLERGVRIEGPARLTGPLHLGEHTLVFGGSVGRSVIGPWCKLRGEISESVLLGWTNKAHDGHLGHALLGRWVNLGAGTTNSDLRNDYGPVRLQLTPDGERRATGLTHVGAFLGDHVKTGIGTLLTTGAVIGAGSQVAGGGLAPTPLPPFAWVTPQGITRYRRDRFEATARTVMARRNCTLTPGVAAILGRLHDAGGGGADDDVADTGASDGTSDRLGASGSPEATTSPTPKP